MPVTGLRTVPGSSSDPLAEAIALTKRWSCPHPMRVDRSDPYREGTTVLPRRSRASSGRGERRTRPEPAEPAAFPAGKTFSDSDQQASSIARPARDALRTLEWLRDKENLWSCGPSGTGKSHCCEALGQAATELTTRSPELWPD